MRSHHRLVPPLFSVAAALLTLAPVYLPAQTAPDPYKKQATTPVPADALASTPPSSNQVATTIEWIELEAKDALTLTRKGLSPNSTELITAIRRAEEQGTAKVLDTVTSVTRSGQRSTVESVQEIIYPTEFKETAAKDLTQLNLSGVQSKEPRFAVAQETSQTPLPSAFEMRPTGTRMEVEPVVSADGRIIEVNLAPELVRRTGFLEYGTANVNGKQVAQTTQPVFITGKVTTSVTLKSGQTLLIGMHTPVKDDGTQDTTKRVLTLLHVVAFSEDTP